MRGPWMALCLALARGAAALVPQHAGLTSPRGLARASLPRDGAADAGTDGASEGGAGGAEDAAGSRSDDDLWRLEKARLVHDYEKAVLKRRPRYLPFQECRKWVQAMCLWSTAEEWHNWLASGEKRNPYIPNDPAKYYKDSGWQGWAHFLTEVDPA
ncbi:hypothetical protein M885DRAFT_591249 [Pelagophyceae sp. CCMP2097]|nr:hypothetical protein M885DRAFT_591249 [Pelagophyceae sp. CCMP2097]|mmetsp:Transcript_28188/g.97068  ORF Transcript_28188/g.97068 Transcript_28188/m.97068 type:complete len:156 (-) Transcript_28188:123-590(-)